MCEVHVKCQYISGVHCSLELATSNSGLQIQDLSSNGTWVQKESSITASVSINKICSTKTGIIHDVSNAKKLPKGVKQELNVGDVILLLAPNHKLCMNYCFIILKSKSDGYILKDLKSAGSESCSSINDITKVDQNISTASRDSGELPLTDTSNSTTMLESNNSKISTDSLTSNDSSSKKLKLDNGIVPTVKSSSNSGLKLPLTGTATMLDAVECVASNDTCLPKRSAESLTSTDHSNDSKKLTLDDRIESTFKDSDTESIKCSSVTLGKKGRLYDSTETLDDLSAKKLKCSQLDEDMKFETDASPSALQSSSEKERCPTCWKLFAVTELPIHCPICQDKKGEEIKLFRSVSIPSSKETVKEVVSVKEVDSMGECPHCSGIFPVLTLVAHAEKCSTKSADDSDLVIVSVKGDPDCVFTGRSTSSTSEGGSSNSVPVKSSLTREESIGQCPNCLELFPVQDLITHCELCTRQTSATTKSTSTILAPPSKVNDDEKDSAARYTLDPYEGPSRLLSVDKSPEERKKNNTGSVAGMACTTNSVVATKTGEATEVSSCNELEQCNYCLKDFTLTELLTHVSVCCNKSNVEPTIEEHCQHCLEVFPLSDLVTHSLNCPMRKEPGSLDSSVIDSVVDSKTASGEAIERCMHCFKDFPLSKIVNHSTKCTGSMLGPRDRYKTFMPSVHDMDPMTMSVLTETQSAALEYVTMKSKQASELVHTKLKERVIKLGYSEKDLERTLQWIRCDAPIIVHVNLDKVLTFLVEDTHYRNLFEVHSSGGSSDTRARKSWEDRIFNKIYDKSPPFEKVKYGVLNIVGDPRGVRSCSGYGDSFLQLKKVRLRATFASSDTSGSNVKLSCCEHYGNVLYEYTNYELKAILDVSTHRKDFLKSDIISHYKEIQIHGPLCLSENVDCLVVNDRHGSNPAMQSLLDTFVQKNKCNLIWMEPESSTSYPNFTDGTLLPTGAAPYIPSAPYYIPTASYVPLPSAAPMPFASAPMVAMATASRGKKRRRGGKGRDGVHKSYGAGAGVKSFAEVERYAEELKKYAEDMERYAIDMDRYGEDMERYGEEMERFAKDKKESGEGMESIVDEIKYYASDIDRYEGDIERCSDDMYGYTEEMNKCDDNMTMYGNEMVSYGEDMEWYADEMRMYVEEMKRYAEDFERYSEDVELCEDINECAEDMDLCREDMEWCAEEMKNCAEDMKWCADDMKRCEEDMDRCTEDMERYRETF